MYMAFICHRFEDAWLSHKGGPTGQRRLLAQPFSPASTDSLQRLINEVHVGLLAHLGDPHVSPNGPTLSITESNEHRQLTHPHNKCPFGRALAFSSKCLMMHLAFKRSDQIRAAVKGNVVGLI